MIAALIHSLYLQLSWPAVASALAAYALLRMLYNAVRTRSMPPFIPPFELGWGVLLYPLFGHVMLFLDAPRLRALAQKYGGRGGVVSMWWMSSPCLISTTQEFVDEIYATAQCKDRSLSKILVDRLPPDATSSLFPGLANAPYHTAEWQRQRKFFMQSVTQYTFTKSMMPVFRAEIKLAFDEFNREFQQEGTADLSIMMKELPLQYIIRLMFGIRFDGQFDPSKIVPPKNAAECDAGNLVWLLNEMFRVVPTFSIARVIPLLKHVDPIYRYCVKLKSMFDAFASTSVNRYLEDHKKGIQRDAPVLQAMIKQLEAGTLTDDDVGQIMLTIFLGGVETTSNTAGTLLMELALRPEVQQKVRDEINAVVPADRLVTEDDMPNLPYFGMVLQESMRLHPVTEPITGRMSTTAFSYAGYTMPAKTVVFPMVDSGYAADRTFKPERFASHPMLDTTGHHELMAFGGGVRVCPGARLAQLEILHLVTNFVKCFQFELVDKSVTQVEMMRTTIFVQPVYKPLKVKKLCEVANLVE